MLPIVNAAINEIGDTSRGKKYNDWYGWSVYQPFCDAGICYCAAVAGESAAVGKFAHCSTHRNWLKQRGFEFYRPEEAIEGDLMWFNYDGGQLDHVALVESVSGGYINTIEFNTGNREVKRRRYKFSDYSSFIFSRPEYSNKTMVNYKAQTPTGSFWTVSIEPCKWRKEPNTSSPVIKSYGVGAQVECVGVVTGQYVSYQFGASSDKWYKSKVSGLYCWSPVLRRQ